MTRKSHHWRDNCLGRTSSSSSTRVGNRCAIDWVLDQYKEKVIDLLMRVTTVSVETVRITEAMKKT